MTAELRACSHEPGTVNYPGARVTSLSHDSLLSLGNVLHCPGASSSSSDHYEFLYFLHKLLQRMNFIHVYTFLVHSGTFYWKNLFQTLIMSMRKTTLAPGQLLRSVHMEKSYLGKAGYPVLYNG